MSPLSPIQCLVVDDEPLARECLENYIREVDFLELAGTATNPVMLGGLLQRSNAGLIFLDIQMPKMSGVDFMRQHRDLPPVILTTAFPGYALEGYELDVVDYLLKPITFARFFQAVTKVRRHLDDIQPISDTPRLPDQEDYFYIKCEQRYERVLISEVLYVKALQNYVEIYTIARGRFVTLLSLSTVETYVPDHRFVRVHKSYLVAIPSITTIEGNELLVGEHRVPISRSQRTEVLRRVTEGRLWTK